MPAALHCYGSTAPDPPPRPRTDGAASTEQSSLWLCRVATEVDIVFFLLTSAELMRASFCARLTFGFPPSRSTMLKRGSSEHNGEGLARRPKGKSKLAFRHCRVASEFGEAKQLGIVLISSSSNATRPSPSELGWRSLLSRFARASVRRQLTSVFLSRLSA